MTTLREAAQAALALVNDTLLERTVDTKRLSAVGRDLEAALDAEPAQPVAVGSWESLKLAMQVSAWDGVLQLDDALNNIDDFAKEVAPQPPADVPIYPNCPHAHECVDGGRYGKGAYEDLMNNAMGGKPWGECLCGIGDDGKPKYQQPPTDVPMLTDEDIRRIWNGMGSFLDSREADNQSFARAVEAEVRRRCGVVE